MRCRPICAIPLAALLGACTPALDWREVRPAGTAVSVMFPCAPESRTRSVTLAGAAVTMTQLSCAAQGQTFAFAHARLADPALVAPALSEWAAALQANLRADSARAQPLVVPGMTPQAQARRLSIEGRLPDGAPVRAQAALFAYAAQIHQAAVVGAGSPQAAAEFLDSLRVAP